MSNNTTYFHIKETLNHKQYVLQACDKMAEYLDSIGQTDLAVALLIRANIHDNSKIVGIELEKFVKIYGNQESFINPKVQLSESQKDIIENHWKNNRHHPEYFENIRDMSELDIIEMVCDWYARSLQYGTDFIDFVKTRQEVRFHFPEDMFKIILGYCEVLAE